MAPEVDIVIRCKDGYELTEACINSILANTERQRVRIILSDDGSSDLQKHWDEVDIYVKHRKAHGAVTATNLGLQASLAFSDSEYVMVMDNDTRVPEGDVGWLDRFIAELERYPDTGCVGATTNYANPPQHILSVPQTYTADWSAEDGSGGVKDNPPSIWFISFCCLLRKGVVRHLGLWDEQYNPGNFEDTDYAVRIREAGLQIRVARSVYIHHEGHKTFSTQLKSLLAENRVKFIRKWGMGRLFDMGLIHPQEVSKVIRELVQ